MFRKKLLLIGLGFILLIIKVIYPQEESQNIDKKHSFGIGYGTNKSFNLFQYTYNVKLSKHISFFALAGMWNYGGVGLSWQSNHDENGFLIGLSSGATIGGAAFNCISSSYQWRLGNISKNISKNLYFSLGISSYSTQYYNKVLEEDINKHEYFPVISLDYHF